MKIIRIEIQKEPIKYRTLTSERDDGMKYELLEDFLWFFRLYFRDKLLIDWEVFIPKGRLSDGATAARDLGAKETGWRGKWQKIIAYLMHSPIGVVTCCWFVHDEVCISGKLADGRKISNLVASSIIGIQLLLDGYKIEPFTWGVFTFLGGGGEARKNGMLWVNNG